MTSYKILLPIAIVFLLIAVTITQAQIPPQISYQAMVSDNTGNPIPDQNLDIQFRIYNDSTGGSAGCQIFLQSWAQRIRYCAAGR